VPEGVYHFGADVLRVGIVVASELPRNDASTLLGALHGVEGFQRPGRAQARAGRRRRRRPGHRAAQAGGAPRVALSHLNVVSVVDLNRDRAGQLLLVMEYVDGVDLARLAATGPLPHLVVIFIVGAWPVWSTAMSRPSGSSIARRIDSGGPNRSSTNRCRVGRSVRSSSGAPTAGAYRWR
jgi:hypothetical protein